ncbi:VOC family protein [Carboxylicivirga sp. N1Y90]|uniref:VOC family protein n=1 Tax=Carboxylicivirga fragile TaxID=3417571 RepID=UPI003D346692|nr:VOC family protein [Marinilabiliaceae bacterium N1Y90]
MATINTYLTFNGNCEEVFEFYKSVFGGDYDHFGRFSEMPSEKPLPKEEADKIMHVSLPISKESVLMGSDSSEAFGKVTSVGDNFSISINAESEEEANMLFNGLSEGGKVNMPLEKTFWGSLFGMFTDKYSINWMVSYDYEQKNQ